ncbi:MAG: glycine cleavage system protein GcvH [Hyphomicrobiales bacterium]|nr:glycine cleavage system protein GcvH [Hyphomicrobiales bacterium]
MSTRYSRDHEWVRQEGDSVVVGISAYAQEQLGDVVFVELPEVGKSLAKGAEAAVVESVKAASEVYAPISGEVLDVNGALADEPATVNQSPEAAGWFFKMKPSDKAEIEALMDADAYKAFLETI